MKKTIIIAVVVAYMTTVLADFSFGNIFKETKEATVSTHSDINSSVDKNSSIDKDINKTTKK
jgi:hypothetical protein